MISRHVVLVFLLLLVVSPFTLAQQDPSRQWVETKGIAFVQDFQSSPARPRPFVAYLNQTAIGYPDRGFYHFRFENSSRESKVPAALVKMIVVQPAVPNSILTDNDRAALVAGIKNIEDAAKKNPSAAASILDLADPLITALQRYDKGDILVDGNWVNRVEHADAQVAQYANQLRAGMSAAPSKAAFDYTRNPFYLQIKALADADPYIAETLRSIEAEFNLLIERESLQEMLVELENPDLPRERTQLILAKFSEQKDPSAVIARILDQSQAVADLTATVQILKRSLNNAFDAAATPPVLPELSEELVSKIQGLMTSTRELNAGKPPAALRIPSSEVRDMVAIVDRLPVLRSQLDSKEFAAAGELSGELSAKASIVGAAARQVFANIRNDCASRIQQIADLTEEAETLAAAGNKKEAAEKLSQALEIMPDSAMEERLAELRKP